LQALLKLQALDTKIADCMQKEKDLPRQKDRFAIQRKRLDEEMAQSEERCKKVEVEQRECAQDIEQRQEKILKYEGQLVDIKKNEEYKAVLHEIDLLKKQIGIREERSIALLYEQEETQAQLEEDKSRINEEIARVEAECAAVDRELAEMVAHREALQATRPDHRSQVDDELLRMYERIRKARIPAVVPLNEESCGGCFMTIRPQIVNEIIGNERVHCCQHCNRLLYYPGNVNFPEAEVLEESV
jgi:predicted  nucleic acid-binding Zn-ribbon protein